MPKYSKKSKVDFPSKAKSCNVREEGKLLNPRTCAARAMHGEKLRNFTETRARAPRARYALISSRPSIQYMAV